MAVALLLSAPAFAFRGRPVSNLHFDHLQRGADTLVASDGSDFMILSTSTIGSAIDNAVYVQKVKRDGATGPRLSIGEGQAREIGWSGSEYLAGWTNTEGLWIVRLSREGSPLAMPAAPTLSGGTHFAVNRTSALAVGRAGNSYLAQPLTLSGTPSGSPVTFDVPPESFIATVSAAGSGFVVVFTGYRETSALMLRADGTPITSSRTIIESYCCANSNHPRSYSAVAATDGTDALIVFQQGLFSNTGVKVAVLGADAKIKALSPQALAVSDAAPRHVQPTSAVWNGSQYVVALDVPTDTTFVDADAAVLRLKRDGEPSALSYAATGERRQTPSGIGWNGSELLVTWNDGTNQGSFGTYGAFFSPSMTAGARFPIGRFDLAYRVRSGAAIATDGTRFLAAWATHEGIFGAFLPGNAPQEVGASFLIRHTATDAVLDQPSLTFDGSDFVAAWRRSGTFATARITRSGAVGLDTPMVRDEGELSITNAFVAANSRLPAVAGYIAGHRAYDDARRAQFVFVDEISGALASSSVPIPLSATSAGRETILVRWQPAHDALGVSIELRLPDRTWRAIGVGAAGTGVAEVSLAGFEGSAIRLRAWNAAGSSPPSQSVPIAAARRRAARTP